MKYLILLLVIAIQSLCLVSCGGTIDPNIPDYKYIEYGSKYKCVLPLICKNAEDTVYKASCVVIDEFYILTAAHVVVDTVSYYVLFNDEIYSCNIMAMHSEFKESKVGYNDIAIGKLNKAIKLDFYPELYKKRDEIGKICGLAGYGFSGNFITGAVLADDNNSKRAGSNIIDNIEKNNLVYSVHTKNKTSLEFLIAGGDSGGGLFIEQKLAGIHSFVYATDGNPNSDYGDFGCSTRISDYIEWIEKTKLLLEKMEGK